MGIVNEQVIYQAQKQSGLQTCVHANFSFLQYGINIWLIWQPHHQDWGIKVSRSFFYHRDHRRDMVAKMKHFNFRASAIMGLDFPILMGNSITSDYLRRQKTSLKTAQQEIENEDQLYFY